MRRTPRYCSRSSQVGFHNPMVHLRCRARFSMLAGHRNHLHRCGRPHLRVQLLGSAARQPPRKTCVAFCRLRDVGHGDSASGTLAGDARVGLRVARAPTAAMRGCGGWANRRCRVPTAQGRRRLRVKLMSLVLTRTARAWDEAVLASRPRTGLLPVARWRSRVDPGPVSSARYQRPGLGSSRSADRVQPCQLLGNVRRWSNTELSF